MFEEEKYYHIFNRSINKELLFKSKENYYFFLKQYSKYLNEFVDTLAYCLMPTHFHLFVKVNKLYIKKKEYDILEKLNVSDVDKGFKNHFISYAKAINKAYDRQGNLFQSKYKKKEVDDESYFSQIVAYIHLNPVKAKLCKSPKEWSFSSYKAIISDRPTMVKREEVLSWFGNTGAFIDFHSQFTEEDRIERFLF